MAMTPGKVIFQNEMMQLIQYAPSTENVLRTPLLIIPPWINKFYILDLRPEKSFIKWCVDQGLTVFVISWVNPDKKLGTKTWEDYMKEGSAHRDGRHREGDGRDEGAHARLLRRRHHARDHARLARRQAPPARDLCDVPRRAGRLHACGRPAGVRRRDADLGAGARHAGLGRARRQQDGDGLQHAQVERPDLVLCRQQLPQGPAAGGVRPAALEFGRHADVGGQPLLLPAQLLPGRTG